MKFAEIRLLLNVYLACAAAAVVLAIPTLVGLCAYNIIRQAAGLKRSLRARRVFELYLLLCVATAAYSSVFPQRHLPSNPNLQSDLTGTTRSGREPTLHQRAVSHASSPLWTISAPGFLVKLGSLPASYRLSAHPAVTGPALLFQPNSNAWGSTSHLMDQSDLIGATVLFVDDSCSAVAVYQAKTGSPPEDGKTPQMPAVASFGEAN